MFGVRSTLCSLVFVITCLSGCDYDFSELDFDLGFGGPELRNVPSRLALGTTAFAEAILAGPEARIAAIDPEILAVERTGADRVKLTTIGVGNTVLFVEENGRRREYAVEVGAHDRHEVLLVERGFLNLRPIAVVEPQHKALLAGAPQRIVVAYYDSQGLLLGSGLAKSMLATRGEECEAEVAGPFDVFCLVLAPGLRVINIDVAGEQERIITGSVPKEDVVDLLLLRTEEEQAEPGDVIRVIAAGLTKEGTLVYGMQAEFGPQGMETFAYEYEPGAPEERILVKAAGFEKELSYRGEFVPPEPLWSGCGGWLGGC